MFVDWAIEPRRKIKMVSLKRELVYSLLIAISLLIAGLVALLWVANTRERRYQDELSDLRRSLQLRDAEVQQLQRQLRRIDAPPVDSGWTDTPSDTLLNR